MKVKLTAGGELDVVTPDELRGILGEAAAKQRRLSPQTDRPTEAVALDNTGAGKVALFKVPAGFEFALHRLTIDADGFTPGAPFTNANGYADILRADKREDFVTFANGIPAVGTWGSADGIRFRNLEVVTVQIVGGPASTNLVLRGQGTLSPLTLE